MPDLRFKDLVINHVRVIGPVDQAIDVRIHVVTIDPNHPATKAGIDPLIRLSLVEGGLVLPQDVGFNPPTEVVLGWPLETHE